MHRHTTSTNNLSNTIKVSYHLGSSALKRARKGPFPIGTLKPSRAKLYSREYVGF